MLATGGSAASAVDLAQARRCCPRIKLPLLGRRAGGRAEASRPRIPTCPSSAAALDRELNENGYILPGLGDAGDRLFGTR
jgi:uracil phosphoribosyltransferase